MEREEFKQFVKRTLEAVIQFAEKESGKPLSRKIAFRWFTQKSQPLTEDIVEHITQRVYIDVERIYPIVDIGVGDILSDGTLVIWANVAGYEPRPFGKSKNGLNGPFNYIIGKPFMDKMGMDKIGDA